MKLHDIDEFLNRNQWLAVVIIAFIFCLMFFGIGAVIVENAEKIRLRKEYLMKECLKDRKEYECESMLKDNSDFDVIIQDF